MAFKFDFFDLFKGDSGGPLVQEGKGSPKKLFLVGVTSFSQAKCKGPNHSPSVFASVGHFLPWIKSILK